jgi:hypothetical protein
VTTPATAPDGSPWSIVAVADLPYPHHLFRCEWQDLHKQLVTEEGDDSAGRRRAFERFVTEIGAAGMASCPCHEGDWTEAARVATEIAASGMADFIDAIDARLAAGADAKTMSAVLSLSDEPIWINGDRLGNGQHRSCAMRAAGADTCPVER